MKKKIISLFIFFISISKQVLQGSLNIFFLSLSFFFFVSFFLSFFHVYIFLLFLYLFFFFFFFNRSFLFFFFVFVLFLSFFLFIFLPFFSFFLRFHFFFFSFTHLFAPVRVSQSVICTCVLHLCVAIVYSHLCLCQLFDPNLLAGLHLLKHIPFYILVLCCYCFCFNFIYI